MLWLIKHLGPIPFGALMFLILIGLLAFTDFLLDLIERREDHNARINNVFRKQVEDGKLDRE